VFVDWHDVTILFDRMEEACGGPDAMAELFENVYLTPTGRALGTLAALFVDPAAFYRLLNLRVGPDMYTSVFHASQDNFPGGYRLAFEITRGHRPSAPAMYASLGACRAQPKLFGLPKASITASITPTNATFLVDVPDREPLPTRVGRFVDSLADVRAAIERVYEDRNDALVELRQLQSVATRVTPRELERRVDEIGAACALTPRERVVLRELAPGRSNKEIAKRIHCAARTVEIHIANVLRKTGTQTRTELVAKLWNRPE
jgi:DNA-binding CsgD family transcriptional regulator